VVRKSLVSRGAEIFALSRSPGDSFLGLESLFFENLVDRSDALLHMAWSTVPVSSEKHVGLEWEQDLPLLIKILNLICSSPKKEQMHFIFFSSGGAVYGQENDLCNPIGWYGHAKLAAERIIVEFGRRHGLTYTILRISNPYGFSVPPHKAQGIVPIILKHARDQQIFSLWGDGTARKDFLHYSDFNEALVRIIEKKAVGIYNVASGESHTINQLIENLEEILRQKLPRKYGPPNSWDVHDSLLDISNLSNAVGWRPKLSFREGLARAVQDLVPTI
jgi:UDP-glucose 4-epimerase